jgi:agmatine deiminase
MPAEWAPHSGCWLAWPASEALWERYLPEVQDTFVEVCRAIADPAPGTATARGETVRLLVGSAAAEDAARAALGSTPAHFHRIPYGDIWLRDTAPIFVGRPDGGMAVVRFGFNGWGGKYLFQHDAELASRIADHTGLETFAYPWILEGGSVEVDGEGTCLTTRQCLLNPNRNPGMDQDAIEAGLREALGVERILWLDQGLLNDHTDGHIDTLARFVAPGVVLCMEPAGADDPNSVALDEAARDLASFTDASGRRLDVVSVPAPGPVRDADGEIIPASYLNFYIGNRAVVVPVYGSRHDDAAVEAIARCFPDRQTVGIPATAVVAGGGGAFHCITQQEPVPRTPR